MSKGIMCGPRAEATEGVAESNVVLAQFRDTKRNRGHAPSRICQRRMLVVAPDKASLPGTSRFFSAQIPSFGGIAPRKRAELDIVTSSRTCWESPSQDH